jgi:hypothetical protein
MYNHIVKKFCKVCGKEFNAKHKNHKYCSIECKDNKTLRRDYIIVCKNCGKEFHPFNSLAKFCSMECVWGWKRKNKKEPSRRVKSKIVKCEICGVEFHPYSRRKNNTCSLKCYSEKVKIKNENKKKQLALICNVCGKEYIPKRSGQRNIKDSKYCSHKCAGIGITSLEKNKIEINKWKRRKASGKSTHLDNLWRYAIYKQGNNVCEYCKKEGQLNAHHIFSRSNFSVRWDLDNGISLCPEHHIYGNESFHKSPAEMLEWIKEKRGLEWYNRLLQKARLIMKPEEAKEKYKLLLDGGQYDKFKRRAI